MRKAAGIILVVSGLLTMFMPYLLYKRMELVWSGSVEELVSTMMVLWRWQWIDASAAATVVVVCGGGICALRRKLFWWSMLGALFLTIVGIGYLMFGPQIFAGILPIIVGVLSAFFLQKTRDDFLS